MYFESFIGRTAIDKWYVLVWLRSPSGLSEYLLRDGSLFGEYPPDSQHYHSHREAISVLKKYYKVKKSTQRESYENYYWFTILQNIKKLNK